MEGKGESDGCEIRANEGVWRVFVASAQKGEQRAGKKAAEGIDEEARPAT